MNFGEEFLKRFDLSIILDDVFYIKCPPYISQVKQKACKIFGSDVAKQMFHDIETITTFHSDYLLPTLRDRLKKW